MNRPVSFIVACVYEVALLGFAGIWALAFGDPLLDRVKWSNRDVAIGILATAPPLGLFFWSLKSTIRALSLHRSTVNSLIRPLFGQWSLLQLGVISLLAGVCEEVLFRAALQDSLASRWGAKLALVTVSTAFGAAHLITWTYGILAAFIGAYLGSIYLYTGNLVTPMVTHALYDFLALVWFLRFHAPEVGEQG